VGGRFFAVILTSFAITELQKTRLMLVWYTMRNGAARLEVSVQYLKLEIPNRKFAYSGFAHNCEWRELVQVRKKKLEHDS